MLTLTVVDLASASEVYRCVVWLSVLALHVNLVFRNLIIVVSPESFPIKAQVFGATGLSVFCVLLARSELLVQNLWQR